MGFLQLLALTLLAAAAHARTCPQAFLRLSDHHSYCLPPNEQCRITRRTIDKNDISAILAEHNALRSRVAQGLESRDGGLPSASNMLEMVWDDTLQAIAQGWVDQCSYNHDCYFCRSVPDYSVGQNLAQVHENCQTSNCRKESSYRSRSFEPDWKGIVDLWYNEVQKLDTNLISNFVPSRGQLVAHFSQVVWAKTWRVGCGYTVYFDSDGKSFQKLYACNYIESGNVPNQPIYIAGAVCSNCPLDSTCTSQGLCKLINPRKPPVWQSDLDAQSSYIFNCDFSPNNTDCDSHVSVTNSWHYIHRITGNVVQAVLQGGQSSTLTFVTKIKPTTPFCLVFVERNGANTFGQQVAGKVSTDIQQPPSRPSWVVDIALGGPQYNLIPLPMFLADTTFSITFTVPNAAPDQYVEFKKIYAYPGNCTYSS